MAQTQIIGKHKTKIRSAGGWRHVKYHDTDVVSFNSNFIILDTGGWKTVTTKTRMNQASNQFDLDFNVYQKDFTWYVVFKDKTFEFENDQILLNRNTGHIYGKETIIAHEINS